MKKFRDFVLEAFLAILWWPLSLVFANARKRSEWKQLIEEEQAELSENMYVPLDKKGDVIIGLSPNGGYWVARRDGFSGWRCTAFSELDVTQKAVVVSSKEKALEWVTSYNQSLTP